MDDAVAPTLAGTAPAGGTELVAGTQLGRYELLAPLGAGAMGEVWSARDPQLDRDVAIKVVHPRLAASVDASQRLLREARAMAKLSHRAVVTVHDAGEVDGRLFLAMELVPGTTLGALLRGREAAALDDWQQWLAMMIEAGRGLAAAHRRGVLHRDFKPDNVLVDTAGRVCVGDFGLATLAGSSLAMAAIPADSIPVDLTSTGALVGTPAYMSPEQLCGHAVTAAADQFAFCVATYEALYGNRPFDVSAEGLSAIAALAAAIEAGPPEPPAGSRVPRSVYEVLSRGLAQAVAARWPTMDDLLIALDSAANLDRRRAVSVMRMEPPVGRRRRGLAIGAIVAGVAAIAAIAWLTWPRTSGKARVTRMFDAPMRATLCLSPDLRYLGVASDRIEVHDLVDNTTQTLPLPPGITDPIHIEFHGGDVRAAFKSRLQQVYRWPHTAHGQLELDLGKLTGYWLGRTVLGDLVYRPKEVGPSTMAIAGGARDLRSWQVARNVEIWAISPDLQRIAYLDDGRFDGRIVVVDVLSGRSIESQPIAGATSLAWIDSRTLAYAAGQGRPAIFRADITDRIGPPTELLRGESGWYGYMVYGGGKLYVVDLAPRPRVRILRREQETTSTQDLDATTASAPVGWLDNTVSLTWNRTNDAIEQRGTSGVQRTKIALPDEPVNATLADGMLIVAVRRADGRDILAFKLGEKEPRWHHELATLAVRCAGDRHAPCYAVAVEPDRERLYPVDPATGTFGPEIPVDVRIEDIAVSDDGTRIALVGPYGAVVEVAPDGTGIAKYPHGMATARSVAYDPTGGFLVAGTLTRNTFQVLSLVPGAPGEPLRRHSLAQTDNDILMLVRPSPSGDRVLVLARVYSPSVLRVELPAAD